MNEKRLAQIEQQIEKIKTQIQEFGVIRPGSLTRQYKDPRNQAGAYYQLSYMRQMKSKTEYVRPHCIPEIKRQIRDYKRWRKIIDRWVELSIQHSQIAMKSDPQRSVMRTYLSHRKKRE